MISGFWKHLYINYITAIPRWWHRHGFGVQSPSDYALVRDVLFESLHYYAYKDQNLTDEWQRQLYRIHLWNPNAVLVACDEEYDAVKSDATDATVIVVDGIDSTNAALWQRILSDERARVTFDMRRRGLVLFNSKRIKQNYLL